MQWKNAVSSKTLCNAMCFHPYNETVTDHSCYVKWLCEKGIKVTNSQIQWGLLHEIHSVHLVLLLLCQ